MALSREDSHFLAFFPVDKTLQILPNQRITFKNETDSDVVDELRGSVFYETMNIDDAGREVVDKVPYEGIILFSGGAAKCRNFLGKANAEVDLSQNVDEIVASLKKLAKEVSNCGKRGASIKLKRVLEKELEDEGPSKKKKSSEKSKTGDKAQSTTKSKKKEKEENGAVKKKSTVIKEIKMKEMMAFAGLSSSPSEHQSRKSPSKSSTPKKSTTPISSPRKPTNSQDDQLKTSTSNAPVRHIKPTEMMSFAGLSSSPSKHQSRKSPVKSSTPKNSTTPRSSPRKPTNSQDDQSKTLTANKTVTNIKPTENQSRRSSPRKSVMQKKPTSPIRPSPKKIPNSRNNTASTPNCRAPQSPLHFEMLDISSIGSAVVGGLNALNCGDQYDELPGDDGNDNYYIEDLDQRSCLENDQEMHVPQPSTSHSAQEFGYNSRMDSNRNDSLQNIVGYYQGLDHTQQSHILSFLHVLIGGLHSYTHGVSFQEIPTQPSYVEKNAESSVDSDLPKAERKLPLIADKNNTYNDVLVNPARLRTAETTAISAKKPAHYLLNKVLEMVYTKEELLAAKGVKSLDQHKLDAIKEFMFARSESLEIQMLNSKDYMTVIQNKIGNLRFNNKKSVDLTRTGPN